MNKRFRYFGVMSIVGIVAMSAGIARADSGSNAVGICTKEGANTNIEYAWNGMLNKDTTASATLDCGLPGSFPSAGAFGDHHFVSKATLNVVDSTTSGVVLCAFRLVDSSGHINFTGSNQTSSDGENSMQWFPVAYGYPFFNCVVPPATSGSSSTWSGVRGAWLAN